MAQATFRESPYTLPPSSCRWALFHMRKNLCDLRREIIRDFEGLRRDIRRIRDDSQFESLSGHALHRVRGYGTRREHRFGSCHGHILYGVHNGIDKMLRRIDIFNLEQPFRSLLRWPAESIPHFQEPDHRDQQLLVLRDC